MPDKDFIKIEVTPPFEKIYNKIRLLGSREANSKLTKYLAAAGREAATRVFWPVVGLKKYAPLTAANKPGRTKSVTFSSGRTAEFRMPWYERGKGSHIPVRGGGWKFVKTSERMGTQWYTKTVQDSATEIGNRAPYAKYVIGEQQARAMGLIGWRKFAEVAQEKMAQITAVYSAWIAKLIRELGL